MLRSANASRQKARDLDNFDGSSTHQGEIAPPLYGPISFAQSAVKKDSTLLSATFFCMFQFVVSMTLETCFVTSLPIC